MADFSTIRASILANLKSMSSVDAGDVIKYGTGEPDGFPFITLESMGMEPSVETDETHNFRTYTFRVRVYIGLDSTQEGPEWAEDTLIIVLDEIIDLFDDDYTLTNTVDNINAVTVDAGYTDFEAGQARTAEIILQVRKLYQLT